ncbi:MAG: ribonucleoside-triphosphate reductase, adenosylcobalamin-dependent [Prochlorotrichaceae cyanobacterium]
MVEHLASTPSNSVFPATAPAANPVFFRTYSRKTPKGRESWGEVCDRTLKGLVELGNLTPAEADLIHQQQRSLRALTSGRWLWIGGTPWISMPENFSGGYNCTSTNVTDWRAFGLMMNLAMMGCGTGAVLEPRYIEQLPPIRNKLQVTIASPVGAVPAAQRQGTTIVKMDGHQVEIVAGDSRQGWVDSYQAILELASDPRFSQEQGLKDQAPVIEITVNLGNVRPSGEALKGFGGVSNPIKLPGLYERCAAILNKAIGRQLTSVECCLLIDEAAIVVVAGNVRRSAGIRQFAAEDTLGAAAKDNLWGQDENGNWRIDPERDALRMANHTRVFHRKPTAQEITDAVRKQFYSGEGAIQYAPEAIARGNADLLPHPELKQEFMEIYTSLGREEAKGWIRQHHPEMPEDELEHRLQRYGLNPCGEILGSLFHCNLGEIHLNQIDPADYSAQEQAFQSAALSVAVLLNHQFQEPRYQQSRLWDPIVGVSFTGLFDFFVHALGAEWLHWWAAGRPDTEQGKIFKSKEANYLATWRDIVHQTIWDYCDRHGLKRPNRCTTVQPSGTKSLLTGASPGWHPPKSQRFLRRITFRKEDAVAMACLDYGYNIIPSQSDKDEQGNLLNDPFDPRCTEWLVEIPTAVSWADLPGADTVDISQFSALAQFDFYMQVQRHYTRHNTSATIELREAEVEPLAQAIYHSISQGDGYMSAALLARFDDHQTFPRLPFEPISKDVYDRLQTEVVARRKTADFFAALQTYDAVVPRQGLIEEAGPAGCDSDKCLLPDLKA